MTLRGVVVAAGYGTRFLPVTRVVPKELLPIVTRPCLDLVAEELAEAGVTELLVITSRRKGTLADWFDHDPELEAAVAGHPIKEPLARPPAGMSVQFVRQRRPDGTGGALRLARAFARGGPTIVAFPDDLYRGANPSAELVEAHRATGGSVLGALDLTGQDVSSYGVIDVAEEGRYPAVRRVVEKPQGTPPSHLISVGRYLYTPSFFDALERDLASAPPGGELTPMGAMEAEAAAGRLHAVRLGGTRHDTGTPAGYLRAVVDHALDDPELGPELSSWLRTRLDRHD